MTRKAATARALPRTVENVTALPVAATPKKPRKKAVRAADVLSYLQKHPEFFTAHADKLGTLSQPKKGGNLLSLHAFQATRAVQQADKLSVRQQRLIATAHANADIAETMFSAVLQVMQLSSLGQLRTWLQASSDGLPALMRLNATRFFLCADKTTATTLTTDDIAALCPPGQGTTLRTLTDAAERKLYGPKGKLITSDALLRLDHPHTGAPLGLLALASTEATRFHAGQSTELVDFFARALAIQLATRLLVK